MGGREEKRGEGEGGEDGSKRRGKRGRRRQISPLPISQPNPSQKYSYSFFFKGKSGSVIKLRSPEHLKTETGPYVHLGSELTLPEAHTG